MKRKILLFTLAVVAIVLIIIHLKANIIGMRVLYTPINYENVSTIEVHGYHDKDSPFPKLDTKKFIKNFNKIKRYQKIDVPISHRTPGPNWNIVITMKNKQIIVLYNENDGKNKLKGNDNKIYIIDKKIVQKILKDNNLQSLWKS